MPNDSAEHRYRFRTSVAFLRLLALSVAVVSGVLTADAQTVFDQNGFGSHRSTYSVLPYEHVDPLSGNLVLVVTDLSLPGNAGLNLKVQRVYNSAVYPNYESGSLALEEDSWAGIGWRLHFGRVLHEDSTTGGGPAIEMSDGSLHRLYHTDFSSDGWMTKEFWIYDKSTHRLKLPNGVVYTFGHAVFLNPDLGVARYVTEIRDPFNNTLTFSYFAAPGPLDGVAQIRQDLGQGQVREVNFDYDPTLKALKSMTYDGRTWNYTQQALGAAGDSLLTAVQPPVGKPWGYTYETAPGYVGLTGLLVPGGGIINYTYGDETRHAGGTTRLARVVRTRAISGHQITQGTWTFSYSQGPNKDLSIVDCPCGKKTYRYLGIGLQQPGGFPAWGSGLLAERTVEEGTTVLEREVLTWRRSVAISPDAIPGENGVWSDPAVYEALLDRRTITRGPQSWTTDFEYRDDRFNEFGRAWRVIESGDLSRTTRREFVYGFGPWIADRVAAEEVQVGAEIVRTEFSYDLGTGFLREQTVGSIHTRFEPTAAGNIDAIVDGNNHRTSFLYAWGVQSEVRTPLLTTTRVISPAGLTLSETIGSLTTQYAYDDGFRPTVIRAPGAPLTRHEIKYEYDVLHQEWVRIARGNAQTSLQLDGFGLVVSTETSLGLKTKTTRDACGRAIFVSAPYTSGTGTRGVTTQYDALDRVRLVTAPDNVSTTQVTYTGIDTTVNDPAGRVTRQDYSAYGQPDDAHLAVITDAANQTTSYSYDVLGNLTRVQGPGPGPARTWSYTSAGLPLNEVHPESGETRYEHDTAGRLTRTIGDDGRITILRYDANNRVIERDASGTDSDITYTYDTLGRIATVTTASVVTTYGYDAVGRMSQRSDVVNGRTFTTTHGYDASDNLTSITYPAYPSNRRTVTYAYDAENRLTTVLQNGAAFAQNITYDDSGRLASYRTDAVTHTFAYDLNDRVQRLTAGPAGAAALDLTYTYDTAGRVERITDPRPGRTESYIHDALDRLTGVAGPFPMSYGYDAAGNRVWAGPGVDYHYDSATKRLMGTTGAFLETFTYDDAGRMVSDSAGTYTYSGSGLLRTVSSAANSALYTYDSDDLRVVKEVNGRKTYTLRSAGGEVLSEYEEDACGGFIWTRDVIHGAGRQLGALRAPIQRPTVDFDTAASTIGEGGGGVAPGVRLITPNGAPLSCAVSAAFDSWSSTAARYDDFVLTYGRVTFPTGSPSGTVLPITPAVSIIDDGSYELSETFRVVLVDGTGVQLGTALQHTVTIVDNDPPPTLSISNVTLNEQDGTANFKVTVSQPSGYTIQASYATADQTARAGRDYTAVSNTVTLNPMSQEQFISIPVTNDGSAEDPETFVVNLSNPSNATIANGQGIATIQDNERPRAPIDLSKPGNYFADGTALIGQHDYVLIGNRHDVDITARLTLTRSDGSGTVREFVVPNHKRVTLEVGNEPGVTGEEVSIAVQSLNSSYALDADHAVYEGAGFQAGRSTEGVSPAPSWLFAEGSVDGNFEEWITVFNPTNGPVNLIFGFGGESGFIGGHFARIEEGPGRYKLRVRDVLGAVGPHATQVRGEKDDGTPVPIVAERTMAWGTDRRETHSSPGVPGIPMSSPTSYFAGGNTQYATFVAIANPWSVMQRARVDYLHENGNTYSVETDVPAFGRATVPTPPTVPAGGFGIRVTTNGLGGFAVERSMYGGPDFTVGTVTVGVKSLSNVWLFEEGSVGFFNTFILLANPSPAPANVWIAFIREDGNGSPLWQNIVVPAGARRTVDAGATPGLSDVAFRTEVYSDQPIVAERATYWPAGGGVAGWYGGHITAGRQP